MRDRPHEHFLYFKILLFRGVFLFCFVFLSFLLFASVTLCITGHMHLNTVIGDWSTFFFFFFRGGDVSGDYALCRFLQAGSYGIIIICVTGSLFFPIMMT